MTIFDVLKKDHEKVATLLAKFEKGAKTGGRGRAALFEELKRLVLAHAKAEDAVFYSRLRTTEEARDVTLEAHEEHRAIERLLDEMSELAPEKDVWFAKFTFLKEVIEHHVKEEEGEMFKKARRELDRAEAVKIGAEMLEQEGKLLARRARSARAATA